MTTTQTRQEPTVTTDPIAALIAAHVPNLRATRRALPTPDADAVAAWEARQTAQARHDVDGTPRGLIPVSGIRCGEHL